MGEFKHYSVMLSETIDGLQIRPDGIYVDGTLGGAGHSSVIAGRLTTGRLIGIDQDRDAIVSATKRLSPYVDRVTIVRDNYENTCNVLDSLGIGKVNGILLDLGVSSYQLDTAERGFSYMADAPLDMRMDDRVERTAADIVNGYSESELYHIIRDYGEDSFAKNIAKHIVSERTKKTIETTGELAEIVKQSIPAKLRQTGGHPAKRTFQAIRIELNRELQVLSDSLDGMIERLAPGGRFCIITFHSLEDRIVKNAFKKAENPCICPPGLPVCGVMAAYREEKENRKTVDRLRNQAYIDGSAVRKPAYQPEEKPVEREERKAKPRKELDRRPLVGFRRGMDLYSVIVAGVFLAFIGFMTIRLLAVNAQVTELNKEITNLTKDYESIQGENNSLLFDIADDINLNEVYRIAVGNLGMVYPNNNQIVEFKSVGDGYVRQYAEVPEAADEGEVDAVTEVLRRLIK